MFVGSKLKILLVGSFLLLGDPDFLRVDFGLFGSQTLFKNGDLTRAAFKLPVARIKSQMYLMKFSKAAGG